MSLDRDEPDQLAMDLNEDEVAAAVGNGSHKLGLHHFPHCADMSEMVNDGEVFNCCIDLCIGRCSDVWLAVAVNWIALDTQVNTSSGTRNRALSTIIFFILMN